jgi:nucleoid-associated protein YgaU
MTLRLAVTILVLALVVSGCATPQSRFRQDALQALVEVGRPDYLSRFPSQHRQMQETLQQGEGLFQAGEVKEADQRYEEVLGQADVLRRALAEQLFREETNRRVEVALRQAEELRQEQERLRLIQEEETRRVVRAQEPSPAPPPPPRVEKEPTRLSSYTVKRGESLPQISARPMVYGDSTLWPLIYRANRDQIRDPRRLWPGQILRIPRNASRDEMAEARRFAQDKQMP